MNGKVPAEPTYCLFREQVNEYAKEQGVNLFDGAFTQISKSQCAGFGISGKRTRMDGKLPGSNIAWLPRYGLAHRSFGRCYKQYKDLLQGLAGEVKIETGRFPGEKAGKAVYRPGSDEIKARSKKPGLPIDRFLTGLSPFPDGDNPDDGHGTLKKVFGQQSEVVADQEVATRGPKDISAQSVRSPHDAAAHYRSKGDRQAKGYSADVTESCDGHDKPNLIAGVSIKEAGTPGTDFLRPGMGQAREVFTEQVEPAHADGAYHSRDDQGFCSENNIEMHLHAIQGNKGRYELAVDGEGGNIVRMVDRKTDEGIPFEPITGKKGGKKRRIGQTKGYRSFTMEEVETALARKKVADMPKGILQKRNNVGATIFQPAYHCSNGKTKYRGVVRHQIWAGMRCLWVNFCKDQELPGQFRWGRSVQ